MNHGRVPTIVLAIVAVCCFGGAARARASQQDRLPSAPSDAGPQRNDVPPTAPSDGVRRVLFELRLAEPAPVRGLTIEATVRNSSRKIYPHYQTVLTNGDLLRAGVIANGGQHDIELVLSSAGAARIAAATSKHRGRPFVIVLDGEIVAALTVQAPLRDRIVFGGDFSEADAKRIAAGLNKW